MNTTLEELKPITASVLIIAGAQDRHNQSAQALADALPGRHVEVPGDHFTAEQSPEFGQALTEFLAS